MNRGRGGSFRGSGSYVPSGGRGGFVGGNRGGRDAGGFHGGGDAFAAQAQTMPQMAQHANLVHQPLERGTEGQSLDLVANYFKLETSDTMVFHYDVHIEKSATEKPAFGQDAKPSTSLDSIEPLKKTPSTDKFIRFCSPLILDQFIAEQKDLFHGLRYVYDGYKNLYTTKALNIQSSEEYMMHLKVDGKSMHFMLRLALVERVLASDVLQYYSGQAGAVSDRTLAMYEILYRFVLGQCYENFRRNHYDLSSGQSCAKTPAVEYVQGFSSAVRMTEFGLALNMHLKTSSMIGRQFDKLYDLISVLTNIRPGERPMRNQLVDVNRMVRHMKFCTKHGSNEITYIIDSLVQMGPKEVHFIDQNGEKQSICQYFFREYGMQLLDLPLVKTTGKTGKFIPLELCFLKNKEIYHFLSLAKINPTIQRELLLKSTHAPNVYFNKLDEIIKKVASTDPQLQRQFGLSLQSRPVTFQGRVLPTPRQLCRNTQDKFYSAASMPRRWAVFCFDASVELALLKKFVEQMTQRAKFFGLNLGEPNPVAILKIENGKKMRNVFKNLSDLTQAEFVFVGIPRKSNTYPKSDEAASLSPGEVYNLVKYYCDQTIGIMSQCFDVDKLTKIPGGYFDNFLLKLNGKLGGLNSALDPAQYDTLPFNIGRTMMIGLDVNQPIESEQMASSVAVAIGSLDGMFSQYTASLQVQKKEGKIIIERADLLIEDLLKQYYKQNKIHPESLIIFRNGVSEGDFGKIKSKEIPLIEMGIRKSGKPTKFTLIVAMKAHSTRFALTEANTAGRRATWNVPSGTVVDHTIVDPMHKMFYLNSHFSPLGISKPTKYVILRDDLNMNADTVQRMTFMACYNSIRTRAVLAIPTPMRYAHLAAYRAKSHVQAQLSLGLTTGLGGDEQELLEAEIIARFNEMVKVNEQLKTRLYYC